MRFRLTYEIVTPESCEYGDAAERGWIGEYGDREPDPDNTVVPHRFRLREALDAMGCGTHRIHADSGSLSLDCPPRWFTASGTNDGTREFYEESVTESRSLHLPDAITPASAMRIARLLGVS